MFVSIKSMDDEIKLEILNYWIETGNIGNLSEEFTHKMTGEDVARLENEIELRDRSNFQIIDVIRYRDKIEDRIERKRRAVSEEKTAKRETLMLQSQWVIAVAAIVTVLIGVAGAYVQYKSYSLYFEQSIPRLDLSLNCPQYSLDGYVNITATVRNSGKTGADVTIAVSILGDEFTTDMYGRLSVTAQDGSSITPPTQFYKSRFIKGDGGRETYEAPDVPIGFNAVPSKIRVIAFCFTSNCKFDTSSVFLCSYDKESDKYVRTVDSPYTP